jgi:hypothetical protein
MFATGLGSVVGGPDVVVVAFDPPPPHAAVVSPTHAKTAAAVTGHSRDRIRI